MQAKNVRQCSKATLSPVELVTPSGTIFGTLMLPDSRARVPVVLIIAGSGPTDRDGNGPSLQLNIYHKLAQRLADNGIATVRYDKRGIAASHAAMSSEADLRLETFVNDATAWLAQIRADRRFSRVVLAGHSEGSLVGMLAAQHAPIDAFVSLEGPGLPLSDVLLEQLEAQLQAYPELGAHVRTIVATLVNGMPIAQAEVPPMLMPLFRPSVQPYLISALKYDPRVEIAKLDCRVVIVAGTHDVQTRLEDGRALAAACPAATFVVIDGMTHVLTDDPGANLTEQLAGAYADATRPLDATLVRTMIEIATGP